MKTKTPYLNLLVLLALMAATLALFYTTNKKLLDVNKLNNEVSNLAQNIDKLNTLKDILPPMKNELSSYKSTLPENESEVAIFAAAVEKIANESSLTVIFHIDDFTKVVEVSSQKMSGLGIQIDLIGSFKNLIAFQTKLSTLPYFYKLDKLSITKSESESSLKTILTGYLMMNVTKK